MDSLSKCKLLSIFDRNNIKLTFEDFNQLDKCLEEVVDECENIKFYQNQKEFAYTEILEVDCSTQKISGKAITYHYSMLFLLRDKNHLNNVNKLFDIYPYYYHVFNVAPFDYNSNFGYDLSADGKKLNGYYYSISPLNLAWLSNLTDVCNVFISEWWNQYLETYYNFDKTILNSYVAFNKNKLLAKFSYAILIRNFIENTENTLDHCKLQNLFAFLKEQDGKYFINDTSFCNIQIPALNSFGYSQDYFAVELWLRKTWNTKEEYFQVLSNFCDDLISYNLLTSDEKTAIMNTTEDEGGILKFRWKDKNTMETKWYNNKFNGIDNLLERFFGSKNLFLYGA